jgi:hypothetical protein
MRKAWLEYYKEFHKGNKKDRARLSKAYVLKGNPGAKEVVDGAEVIA